MNINPKHYYAIGAIWSAITGDHEGFEAYWFHYQLLVSGARYEAWR